MQNNKAKTKKKDKAETLKKIINLVEYYLLRRVFNVGYIKGEKGY